MLTSKCCKVNPEIKNEFGKGTFFVCPKCGKECENDMNIDYKDPYKKMLSKKNIKGIVAVNKKVINYVAENMVKGKFKHELTIPKD